MTRDRFLSFAFLLVALNFSVGASAAETPIQVLHRFQGAEGVNPYSTLISDKAGNFYGTTKYGGAGGYYGTIFELSPPPGPGKPWTYTTLYSFLNDGDGARPTAGLVMDNAGNLYGTTSDENAGGDGEVIELSPPVTQGGQWVESVIYRFTGGDDGAGPHGGLIFDRAGNLYGTTASSVFQLQPPGQPGGSWTFHLLHQFTCCKGDGWVPLAGLVMDEQGNLYGTTEWGGYTGSSDCGSVGCGTVFEVSPPSAPGTAWQERVLHVFAAGDDGFIPYAGLAIDRAGNLYGTTYSGGKHGGGTAFELSPPSQPGGDWTKITIHGFSYGYHDGAAPVASMIFDKEGNLYGTAQFGGARCVFNGAAYGCGGVFELTPPSGKNGVWVESLVHYFTEAPLSPRHPAAGLIFDKAGNLFGTTPYGGYATCSSDGSDGCGTIYEVIH